jgi:hypothetical protein
MNRTNSEQLKSSLTGGGVMLCLSYESKEHDVIVVTASIIGQR